MAVQETGFIAVSIKHQLNHKHCSQYVKVCSRSGRFYHCWSTERYSNPNNKVKTIEQQLIRVEYNYLP